MNIKRIIVAVIAGMAIQVATATPTVFDVTAQQRHPWNGLVDITVTIQGTAEDVAEAECFWAATNSATRAAIPIKHITQNGADTGSGPVWTRKFIWDAKSDIGAVKINDVALTVDVKFQLGGVQLWENGPYWAECNVGASQPEECGYYFWWGDTVGYKRNANNNGWLSVKDSTSFSFGDDNCPTFLKNDSQLQSAGYIDATGNLVAKYDAATAHRGAPWRMPTDAEFSALINNCTTTWTTRNGVSGRLVTGKGGYASKSIFLPAAGWGSDSSLHEFGSFGMFWSSSTPYSDSSYDALHLYFNLCEFGKYVVYRIAGAPVRPVRGFASPGVAVGGATTHLALDCLVGTVIVTFNANGGSCPTSSKRYEQGAALGELTVPTFDDLVFDGWYTAANGGTRVTEMTEVTKDVTYYARWKGTKVVDGIAWSFVVGDGHVILYNGDWETVIPTDTKGDITVPSELCGLPVIEIGNYAFEYCSGITSITVSEGVTRIGFYAFRECTALKSVMLPSTLEYMGECVFGGGWNGMSSLRVVYYCSQLPPACAGSIYDGCPDSLISFIAWKPSTDTWMGRAWQNWTPPAGGAGTSGGDPERYLVTFNANGGTCSTSTKQYEDGATIGTLPMASRSGYMFDSWYTLASGGMKVSAADIVSSAMTIYAHWINNRYSVRFHANGGEGQMEDQSFSYDNAQNLSACAFTKTGYSFAGWAAAESGGSTVYADGATVKNLTAEAGGVVNLYAVWEVNSYALTAKPTSTKYGSVSGSGSYAEEDVVTLVAKPKSGYALSGWYTDKNCKNPLNPEGYDNRNPKITYVMPAKKVTIYAKFISKSSDKSSLKFSSSTAKLAKSAKSFTAGKAMSLALGFTAKSLPTVTAKSLPKGMSIDSLTGEITGTPTKPGKYTATVTVKTAAGNKISQKVKIYVKVPSGSYGTFDGYALVKTTPAYVTFTSDKYGAVSGKVTYKGKGYSFKASYSSTSSTKSKFTPSIKIGSSTYKPVTYVEKLTDGITVSQARGEQKGKFVFVAQKKPGLIKVKKALAGLIDQTMTVKNKEYADAKLPKSSDKLTLKFAATDVVKVTGKLKGKSVSFSTTVIYCAQKGDVYTAEAALVEPKSGYSKLVEFMLTLDKKTKRVGVSIESVDEIK